MSDTVLYDVQDAIGTITLNRPESLNAMDTELLDTLVTIGRKAAEDPGVRCVVITGAGRAFCAGGDVKGMASRGSGEGGGRGVLNGWGRLREQEEISRLLHEMPKPTIAAINGPAAGAGMSIALAADFRIMSDQARIVPAFAKVGFSGDFGGTWFLQRLVGAQRAREIYMLAEPITPDQALADRIVNKVVPHERLMDETMALARRLASGPTLAFGRMKQNFSVGASSTLADALTLEAQNMVASSATEDHRNAALAFVEKREPEFKGR
ncbi:MAG: enoyl-CoA hydratase [Dehalococcoidia bacterium]